MITARHSTASVKYRCLKSCRIPIPKHLFALLEALYNDHSAVIRWNSRHSSAFKIVGGVRQGCILSPHLFNVYTESVIREADIEEIKKRVRDGGCKVLKCVIQGKVSGKRRRGRPNTSYCSDITKLMSESMERITRDALDRAGWRRLVRCAARAADHHC